MRLIRPCNCHSEACSPPVVTSPGFISHRSKRICVAAAVVVSATFPTPSNRAPVTPVREVGGGPTEVSKLKAEPHIMMEMSVKMNPERFKPVEVNTGRVKPATFRPEKVRPLEPGKSELGRTPAPVPSKVRVRRQ